MAKIIFATGEVYEGEACSVYEAAKAVYGSVSREVLAALVNGESKAKILEEAFFGPITPANPASILQLHPDVVVCGDAPAMAIIAEKHPEAIIG